MKNNKIKCSLPKHQKNDAISYCQECKINLCVQCQNIHSGLCIKHHTHKLDKNINDIKDIFTGFCKEENHYDKLEFYCNSHNVLCCSACISKIIREGKGEHNECDICNIEDIKSTKKESLEKNIELLQDLSNTFEESIFKLKKNF